MLTSALSKSIPLEDRSVHTITIGLRALDLMNCCMLLAACSRESGTAHICRMISLRHESKLGTHERDSSRKYSRGKTC